ncbi:MAG: hypothetical protein HKO57_03510, partial [Akkermansiaceae bacterium]|nr:hypothetical protein [Akkermansiaceae bacterium]
TGCENGLEREADRRRDDGADNNGFPPIRELETVVFDFGAVWRYNDSNVDLGTEWKDPAYRDRTWKSGPAEFGFGEGDEDTLVADLDPNVPSIYFRKAFELPRVPRGGAINLKFDDGAAVWVNGRQVAEFDFGDGAAFSEYATGDDATNRETVRFDAKNPFVAGKNLMAVMVKNVDEDSSDLSFDARLALEIDPPGPGSEPDPFFQP